MYELSVKMRFSAAHRLRDYQGDCATLHGHNWDVEAFVCGERLNKLGLLLDFRTFKDSLRAVLDKVDHVDLNTIEDFVEQNPTSERIAAYIYHHLSEQLSTPFCRVSRVTVWETPESAATYSEPVALADDD